VFWTKLSSDVYSISVFISKSLIQFDAKKTQFQKLVTNNLRADSELFDKFHRFEGVQRLQSIHSQYNDVFYQRRHSRLRLVPEYLNKKMIKI
jgi:hypothetical protein